MTLQRIVLTGGPGAGKTSVLSALAEQGERVGQDAAREIIRLRKAVGLSPRSEPKEFAEKILAEEILAFDSISSGRMFYERGVADAVAFLSSVNGIDEPSAQKLLDRYRYEKVFIFPAWQDIYCTDDERDHDFEHALAVYGSTRAWYERIGYNVLEVPCTSVHQRVSFIMDHL